MDSVIMNGDEPKLLQLTVWFDAKYEKDTRVTIQVGTRAPLIHNQYMPATRVYFYDIAQRNALPLISVTYNALKLPIDLSEHQEGQQASIKSEEISLFFVYELLSETGRLEQKYWNAKDAEDKISRGEGLNNLVRAQSEFLSLFERDEEVEQIRAAEIEEEKIERDISEEIINLRRAKVELKVIVVLAVVFFIIGFLFRALQTDQSFLHPHPPPRQARRREPRRKNNRI